MFVVMVMMVVFRSKRIRIFEEFILCIKIKFVKNISVKDEVNFVFGMLIVYFNFYRFGNRIKNKERVFVYFVLENFCYVWKGVCSGFDDE